MSRTAILFLMAAFLVIVGLLANLLTPWIRARLDGRTTSYDPKTLARLEQEYSRIKRLHDMPVERQVRIFLLLVGSFTWTLFLVSRTQAPQGTFLTPIVDIVADLVMLVPFAALGMGWGEIWRLRNFEQYEKTHLARRAKIKTD